MCTCQNCTREKYLVGDINSEFSDCIEVFVCDLLILIKILYILEVIMLPLLLQNLFCCFILNIYQPKGVVTNIVEGEVQFLKKMSTSLNRKKRRPPKYKNVDTPPK